MGSLLALAPVSTGQRTPLDPQVWSTLQAGMFLVGAILFCMGLVARMKQTASDAGPPGSLWFVAGACMMGIAALMYMLS